MNEPVEFHNDYEIHRTDDESVLVWAPSNPAFGNSGGRFVFVDDAILTSQSLEDGRLSGSETLIQIDERTYKNIGTCFGDGKRISSWSCLLEVEKK